MRVTLDLPVDIITEIQQTADRDEFGNRSAVIRKALKFFFSEKARKSKNDPEGAEE